MMRNYRPCVFCGRTDSKPSREDILARWISREFPQLDWEVTDLSTQKTFKTTGNLGLISKKPCQRCNNGWMAKLEEAAKPILVPLMDGKSLVLTPEQQHTVVSWFIKIIMGSRVPRERPVPLLIRPEPDTQRPVLLGQGYSVTIIIKQLALQVFALNKPAELRGISDVNIKMGKGWDNLSVQVWPTLGDASWPPEFALDDDWLNRFTNRWTNI